MSVTHIAAAQVTIDDRYLRQRCGWCGEILTEYDLARVAVPAGQDPNLPRWATGGLVTVDGNASWVTDGTELPDDACARNPLTLVSLTG